MTCGNGHATVNDCKRVGKGAKSGYTINGVNVNECNSNGGTVSAIDDVVVGDEGKEVVGEDREESADEQEESRKARVPAKPCIPPQA